MTGHERDGTTPGVPARVRVMLVEDSLVVRQLLIHIVGRDPRLDSRARLGRGRDGHRRREGGEVEV
ncbi:MAG: hypothetical protein EOO66_23080, partial [Methylobacterium sp.]